MMKSASLPLAYALKMFVPITSGYVARRRSNQICSEWDSLVRVPFIRSRILMDPEKNWLRRAREYTRVLFLNDTAGDAIP